MCPEVFLIVAGCHNVLGVKKSLCTIFFGTPCMSLAHICNSVMFCIKGIAVQFVRWPDLLPKIWPTGQLFGDIWPQRP